MTELLMFTHYGRMTKLGPNLQWTIDSIYHLIIIGGNIQISLVTWHAEDKCFNTMNDS
jgi:hypothetical protein